MNELVALLSISLQVPITNLCTEAFFLFFFCALVLSNSMVASCFEFWLKNGKFICGGYNFDFWLQIIAVWIMSMLCDLGIQIFIVLD